MQDNLKKNVKLFSPWDTQIWQRSWGWYPRTALGKPCLKTSEQDPSESAKPGSPDFPGKRHSLPTKPRLHSWPTQPKSPGAGPGNWMMDSNLRWLMTRGDEVAEVGSSSHIFRADPDACSLVGRSKGLSPVSGPGPVPASPDSRSDVFPLCHLRGSSCPQPSPPRRLGWEKEGGAWPNAEATVSEMGGRICTPI